MELRIALLVLMLTLVLVLFFFSIKGIFKAKKPRWMLAASAGFAVFTSLMNLTVCVATAFAVSMGGGSPRDPFSVAFEGFIGGLLFALVVVLIRTNKN